MKNRKPKTDKPKITLASLLEYTLFICTLIVIVLRATYTEAPLPQTPQIQSAIHDTVYSLVLSGVLVLLLMLLLSIRLFNSRLSFKLNFMEIAFALLLIAAVVASVYAPNKRAAINASIIFLSPAYGLSPHPFTRLPRQNQNPAHRNRVSRRRSNLAVR